MNPPYASPALHEPLWRFCGSHAEIRDGLQHLGELPALADAVARARADATAALELFERQVVGHQVDEEEELFVAVARSARGTEDEEQVTTLVARLKGEHRGMERLWAGIRPAVLAISGGKAPADAAFAANVAALVARCRDHARLEEEVFLPLADRVLARNPNHLAALDLSLYMRHAPIPRLAYV